MSKQTKSTRAIQPGVFIDRGPMKWRLPFLEARYTRLSAKPRLSPAEVEKWETELKVKEDGRIKQLIEAGKEGKEPPWGPDFQSLLQPGRGRKFCPMFVWNTGIASSANTRCAS
jgi:hypothetical protein